MATLKQLYNIALLRLENKNLAGAENLLQQVLLQAPSDALVKHQLAKIALEQNQVSRARELLEEVSTVITDNADVLIDLGRAYTLSNCGNNAIACLERACTLAPQHANAYRYRAEACFAVGHFDEAAQHAQKAIFLSPVNADALSILGDALLEKKEVPLAIKAYDDSAALNPDSWKVHANKGIAYMHIGEFEQAQQCLLLANALNPMQPSVALPLVSVLIDQRQYNDAQLLLDRLQAALPRDARVHTAVGDSALAQGNTVDAVASFVKALSIDDENIGIQLKLANALAQDGKVPNAILFYDQILLKNRTVVSAAIEKANLQVLCGDYQIGFENFTQLQKQMENSFDCPLLVDQPLADKTVLLYSGTCLDDFNVLLRFAKIVKERGAKVIVQCPTPIQSLVQQMTVVDQTIRVGDETPRVDFHAPLECLPSIYNIPVAAYSDGPYLAPENKQVAAWQKKMMKTDGFKVGIMWQKETDTHPNVLHSIVLNAMAPIFEVEQTHFVSLGSTVCQTELDNSNYKDKLHRIGLENVSFEERLSCIAALDLLITVDTLTAQVACAAGLPTWVLLGNTPQWQYGNEGEQTVWHPSARLFRRKASETFNNVVNTVAQELQMHVEAARTKK